VLPPEVGERVSSLPYRTPPLPTKWMSVSVVESRSVCSFSKRLVSVPAGIRTSSRISTIVFDGIRNGVAASGGVYPVPESDSTTSRCHCGRPSSETAPSILPYADV